LAGIFLFIALLDLSESPKGIDFGIGIDYGPNKIEK
jgi:hypothetical protein